MLKEPMDKLPANLTSLISFLKKLPGVGIRTAERFAFEFLTWPSEDLEAFADLIKTTPETIPPCPVCGCLTDKGACSFCDSNSRDTSQICLISSPRDAFAIEATRSYRGLYHVIEHLLSPLDQRHASALRLDRIEERLSKYATQEIIIAFDSTLEGDTTALFLRKHLASHSNLKISRLAFGLPVGSSLEYIDGNTLSRSFSGRQIF
jgi:recombination protein RecR